MNKLDLKLNEIKKRGKIGLMAHTVIGYPSLKKTYDIVLAMAEAGADIIELQIPFSDPLADGPTIMKACEQSLRNGTKVKDAFQVAKKLSEKIKTPLLFMCYYNTVFKYGVENFCADASEVGITGLIVPDMPLDEEKQEHFYEYARKYNLHTIRVISPASTDKRLKMNAEKASGFVYSTARQGITGARNNLDPTLNNYLNKVKKFFQIPLAVGFGISKKEHVEALVGHADIAIVGSALIDIINKANKKDLLTDVGKFIKSLQVE